MGTVNAIHHLAQSGVTGQFVVCEQPLMRLQQFSVTEDGEQCDSVGLCGWWRRLAFLAKSRKTSSRWGSDTLIKGGNDVIREKIPKKKWISNKTIKVRGGSEKVRDKKKTENVWRHMQVKVMFAQWQPAGNSGGGFGGVVANTGSLLVLLHVSGR